MTSRLKRPVEEVAAGVKAVEDRVVRLEEAIHAILGRLDWVAGRFDLTFDKIRHGESRHDDAEKRLDGLEWKTHVLRSSVDGLTAHLEGLSHDHVDLERRFQEARVAYLMETLAALESRQTELEERMQACAGAHWDQVALARRLATIEDLLIRLSERGEDGAAPSEPSPLVRFPGDENRSLAG